jgi:hypothetical protein
MPHPMVILSVPIHPTLLYLPLYLLYMAAASGLYSHDSRLLSIQSLTGLVRVLVYLRSYPGPYRTRSLVGLS